MDHRLYREYDRATKGEQIYEVVVGIGDVNSTFKHLTSPVIDLGGLDRRKRPTGRVS